MITFFSIILGQLVGGVVSDLATHWEYIKLLKNDLTNLLKLTLGVDGNAKLINFLFTIIFSQLFL